MDFKEIYVNDINENFFTALKNEYMLISAGSEKKHNMMTASWGFFGEMWGHSEAIAVIRPQRFTMDFVNENKYFALSFYGDKKEIHKVCGSLSGRDVNKTEKTGLTPIFADNTVYFKEARLVIICEKEYVSPFIPEGFCSDEPLKWYNGDFHNMVFGKIIKILAKEN